MPDDRAQPEVINDDEAFDNWMILYERKMLQRTMKKNKISTR